MTPPLVSVIMPAYNAAKWVEEAVHSVLEQRMGDLELIVVDDGSTDATASILRSITDPRLLVVHQANAGVSAARNKGIDHARGNFITFLDADDRMTADNLERKVEELRAHRVDWVFSDIWRCDERMQPIGQPEMGTDGDVVRALLSIRGAAVPGISSNILAHRRCFAQGLRFDPALSNQADQDIVLGLARHFTYRRIPVPLNQYRTVPGSMSRNIALFEKDMLHFFHKARRSGLLDDPGFRRYCLGNAYWAIGGSWWKNAGERRKALPWFLRAMLLRPGLLLRPFRSRKG